MSSGRDVVRCGQMVKAMNWVVMVAVIAALAAAVPYASAAVNSASFVPMSYGQQSFTDVYDFKWEGDLSGGFVLRWEGKSVTIKPVVRLTDDREYALSDISDKYASMSLKDETTDLSNKWEFAYRFDNVDEKFKSDVSEISFVVTDFKGLTDADFRMEGSKLVISESLAIDYSDLVKSGFVPVESPTKYKYTITGISDVKESSVYLDPYITAYPYQDGYVEYFRLADLSTGFEVYNSLTTLSIGNNIGTTDRIFRAWMQFNTSIIDPWDTIVNRTLNFRITSETCGSGNSNFTAYSVPNYDDLGFGDWSTAVLSNAGVIYNTSIDASGYYARNLSNGIIKGGVSYFRIQGSYENWDGVDCFLIMSSNESANSPSLTVYWTDGIPDTSPPNVSIQFPQNTTYNCSTPLTINASGYDASGIANWTYSLNGAANLTLIPNVTSINAVNGSNNLRVWATDIYSNKGSAVVYFTGALTPPVITIGSPDNTTYNMFQTVYLNASASVPIHTWLYSLNGSANASFTPNVTQLDLPAGYYHLVVYGNCSTYGIWGSTDVYFTVEADFGDDNVTSIGLYYPPYAKVGDNVVIHAVPLTDSGICEQCLVSIQLDGFDVLMSYVDNESTFQVIWIPAANGDYDFNVTARSNFANVTATGGIAVRTPFVVTVRMWTNINMTPESRYENEFSWIYMTKDVDPTLHTLFGVDKFACPPEGSEECYWHGEYINGTATVTLYEEGNYSMYIIGNNIDWSQFDPAGNYVPCTFCEPHIIQSRFRLNLGSYYFSSPETIDLLYSQPELYWSGLWFGTMSSWLALGILTVIGFAAFFVILFATGSLKSALAGLLLLPTIIYIITHLILW